LDNPKTSYEENEMMVACSNFVEDNDEVSMEKMQQKRGSRDDAFQLQMQTKREAILDN